MATFYKPVEMLPLRFQAARSWVTDLKIKKLLSKLPSWTQLRWNRQGQETIDSNSDYPSLFKFVDFVIKEARIACNPVSSLYALKDTDPKPSREHKDFNRKVNVLAPTSTHQHNTTRVDTRLTQCDCCEIEGHSLSRSENFAVYRLTIKKNLKKNFVLDFYTQATETETAEESIQGESARKNTLLVCMMMYLAQEDNKQRSRKLGPFV